MTTVGKLNKRLYRDQVKDLFKPNLKYYFTDFFISYSLMLVGAIIWMIEPSILQWGGYILAVYCAYRCFLFIHENVHLPRKEFAPFVSVWDLLLGSLFLMPTFMYESHMDHHIPKKYGTIKDPEYLPLGGKNYGRLCWFMAEHMVITPLVIFMRFLIGLPVRFLVPPLSRFLDERLTALIINFTYSRVKKADAKVVMRMEASALFFAILFTYLISQDILDIAYLLKGIAIILGALFINALRTLAAHRYANKDLGELNEEEQLIDSLNYTGNPLIGLFMAPIGLRYHALHHLFPTIPYHNLDIAHERIMNSIEDDDPYHKTNINSYTQAILRMPKDDQGV
ncbi:fatty acid desaturase [Temperatibacter marinus]|uniref:Fatty acid desaturase n=1 Tax=Temperatibacter marinus TaxID=1456591 RepID=A0AA52ED92_9PROT|nr:fatty acid desaturase [Temperatibacter marinus]WND02641.1 fatty acid desaturase [Temperatibacter marinus]